MVYSVVSVYIPVKDRVSPGPSDYDWTLQPSKRSQKYYTMRPKNYNVRRTVLAPLPCPAPAPAPALPKPIALSGLC